MNKIVKLSELTPSNLHEEEEKFFANGCKSNPQFTYQREFSKEELEFYGKPKLWYLFLAKRIVKKYQKSAESQDYLENKPKDYLNQQQLEEIIRNKLDSYNLSNVYQIIFSDTFVSRIAVNNKNKQIKIRLPINITIEEIKPILSHEIDTHVLRQINYEKQPWHGKKKKHGLRSHLMTEEGLAVINELVVNGNKLALKSAVNYVAVDLALKKDFVSVFNFLDSIFHNKERAWTWAVKKKRGMLDTGKPGAYTKDLLYFEGFVRVLEYLVKNNFDSSKLYYGKIDYRDVNRMIKDSEKNLLLPTMLQEKSAYRKAIGEIVKENLL